MVNVDIEFNIKGDFQLRMRYYDVELIRKFLRIFMYFIHLRGIYRLIFMNPFLSIKMNINIIKINIAKNTES
jgi:hypothetical protein